MSSVIKASVTLAVLVMIVSVVYLATGMHQTPALGFVTVIVFIVFNIGCLIWALSSTAAENGYGKQLLNAVVFGVVAGVLIFGSSLLQSTVLFPNSLEETKTATIEMYEGMNMPEAQLEKTVKKIESLTPVSAAVPGTIGTFFTSLIVGAIVAIFKRKKV